MKSSRSALLSCFGEALLVFTGTLALLLLLQKDVFYKADGQQLLQLMRDRQFAPDLHVLYLPGYYLLDATLGWLGLSTFRLASLYSALGVASGAAFVQLGHRALGFGLAPRSWMTALLVSCPSLLLFGTIVELHGPFVGAAGLCYLQLCLLVERPTWLRASVLGLLFFLASGMHGSGALLPAPMLLGFLAMRRGHGELWRDVGRGALAGGLFLALFFSQSLLYQAVGLQAESGAAVDYVDRGFSATRGLQLVPQVFWQEWLRPIFPLSFALLAGIARRELRLEFGALLLGMLPYLVVSALLIAGDPEEGAYLLPLAFFAARLAVQALPQVLVLGLVLLSLALGLREHFLYQSLGAKDRAFAEAIADFTRAESCLLLIGGYHELNACWIWLPDTQCYSLQHVAQLSPEILHALLPRFDEVVVGCHERGVQVILTQDGESFLRDPRAHPLGAGPLLLEHLEQRFSTLRLQSGEIRARLLLPRDRLTQSRGEEAK